VLLVDVMVEIVCGPISRKRHVDHIVLEEPVIGDDRSQEDDADRERDQDAGDLTGNEFYHPFANRWKSEIPRDVEHDRHDEDIDDSGSDGELEGLDDIVDLPIIGHDEGQ
jgi:hypothetical protein